jgi:hypothetical protein
MGFFRKSFQHDFVLRNVKKGQTVCCKIGKHATAQKRLSRTEATKNPAQAPGFE